MGIERMRIDNARALTDVFGRWPSFHDAEIHRIRLDRGIAGPPSLEADVNVFEITSDVTPSGYYALKNHTLSAGEMAHDVVTTDTPAGLDDRYWYLRFGRVASLFLSPIPFSHKTHSFLFSLFPGALERGV